MNCSSRKAGGGRITLTGICTRINCPACAGAWWILCGACPPDSVRMSATPGCRPAKSAGGNCRGLKAAFIGAFGRRMQHDLAAARLPTNDGFAGIYDFKQWQSYPGYLPKFLDCLRQPNGILVAHPGLDEDWRKQEFESLRDCAPLAGRLNRFQHFAA